MVPTYEKVLYPKDDEYIFELSGEHETLPKAEIMAILESKEVVFETLDADLGVLVLKVPKLEIDELTDRLALSHVIDSHIYSGDVKDVYNLDIPIRIQKGTFAVRARRIQNQYDHINLKKLEKRVADCVEGENTVYLENPENEIRVIISKRGHLGEALARIPRNEFEGRKVQNRPYFSPISLHPRLARALVNLSRVKKGESLLDPFCGTGGILIEASMIGVKAKGSDIDPRMVEGCKKNLAKFNMGDAEVFQSDIGKIKETISKVDAIATDPPYGKSATTNREDVKSLYIRAFLSISDVLKKGRCLSIVLPNEELIGLGKEYLHLIECHPHRVHRSLTRNFCVFQKN